MTAHSMLMERQSLETGFVDSQTIWVANSTAWFCFPKVHFLANGEINNAGITTSLFATMVRQLT